MRRPIPHSKHLPLHHLGHDDDDPTAERALCAMRCCVYGKGERGNAMKKKHDMSDPAVGDDDDQLASQAGSFFPINGRIFSHI